MPVLVKYTIIAVFIVSWKWLYYAPNTFKMLTLQTFRRAGKSPKFPPHHKRSGETVPLSVIEKPWTTNPRVNLSLMAMLYT